MSRPLSVHQITAIEAGPVGLVSLASANGCSGVCIFTQLPANLGKGRFPVVDEQNKNEMRSAMNDLQIVVSNVEFFPITADAKIEDYSAGLALGAELGASRAVCHVHDQETDRAVQSLGKLAELAASHGMALGLEFMGMTAGCRSLDRAVWFVDQVARRNLGIAVDMLHLVRTGGSAAEVAALDDHYFSYAQICDGHGLHLSGDYMAEAFERALPGDGDFPVKAIIEALPLRCPLDIEVPSAKRVERNVSAAEWATEAISRSRALVESASTRR